MCSGLTISLTFERRLRRINADSGEQSTQRSVSRNRKFGGTATRSSRRVLDGPGRARVIVSAARNLSVLISASDPKWKFSSQFSMTGVDPKRTPFLWPMALAQTDADWVTTPVDAALKRNPVAVAERSLNSGRELRMLQACGFWCSSGCSLS